MSISSGASPGISSQSTTSATTCHALHTSAARDAEDPDEQLRDGEARRRATEDERRGRKGSTGRGRSGGRSDQVCTCERAWSLGWESASSALREDEDEGSRHGPPLPMLAGPCSDAPIDASPLILPAVDWHGFAPEKTAEVTATTTATAREKNGGQVGSAPEFESGVRARSCTRLRRVEAGGRRRRARVARWSRRGPPCAPRVT